VSIVITGVAGFIGSNLAAALVGGGKHVVGLDNLSLGSRRNLEGLLGNPAFAFETVALDDLEAYRRALSAAHARSPVEEIWHLAASSDIPAGVADARVDLRDTFITTFNTLLLMKELDIGTLAFASSSAVYGDLGERSLTEDLGPLFPISNYGAMKLASEGAISAALESHLQRAFIFRFPNVVGVPATHGVILDFVRKLKADRRTLRVLGDGTQQKAYLHVGELVDAMLFIRRRAAERLSYYNIGADDLGVSVRHIAQTVVAAVAPGAAIAYGQGNKGWVGDVPRFSYSTAKLAKLGWSPAFGSAEAVAKAVREIARQESAA
jgi:UDP-glucose 4-epimerase